LKYTANVYEAKQARSMLMQNQTIISTKQFSWILLHTYICDYIHVWPQQIVHTNSYQLL